VRLPFSNGYLSVVSDRNVIPPFGVLKGYAGYPNRFVVKRGNEIVEPSPLPGKITNFEMNQNDILVELSNGGGGYGDPLDRDPQLVRRDVLDELISIEKAETRYGVILKDGEVDEKKTQTKREEIRSKRLYLTIEPGPEEEYVRGKRITYLNPETTESLGLKENDLVEIIGYNGVPLRAWVGLKADFANETLSLGKIGQQIIGVSLVDKVWVRKINRGEELL
jgi:hypothetical protein